MTTPTRATTRATLLPALGLAALLAGCYLPAGYTPELIYPVGLEQFDHRTVEDEDGRRMIEYLPRGQSQDGWRERLTVQEVDGPDEPLQSLADAAREQLLDRCPHAEWELIDTSERGLLYEWYVTGCEAVDGDRHELVRVMQRDGRRFRLAYTARVAQLTPDERSQWLQFLGEASVRTY